MIELAPNHKYGLTLSVPVMPASGAFGYGDVYHELVDVSRLGAVVTNPVSLRARRAAGGKRLGVWGDHFVVHTGWPNPGLRRVVRQYRTIWERLDVPVIVHLLATRPSEVHKAMIRLAEVPSVRGVELSFAADTSPERTLNLLAAAREPGDLPVIAQVPFGQVEAFAPLLVRQGVDALTLTAPPRAVLPLRNDTRSSVARYMRGRLYGAALFPMLLDTLSRWAKKLDVPVVACGGIAAPEDAMACLNLGAAAVQVDALLWRDPTLLDRIVQRLTEPLPASEVAEGEGRDTVSSGPLGVEVTDE